MVSDVSKPVKTVHKRATAIIATIVAKMPEPTLMIAAAPVKPGGVLEGPGAVLEPEEPDPEPDEPEPDEPEPEPEPEPDAVEPVPDAEAEPEVPVVVAPEVDVSLKKIPPLM